MFERHRRRAARYAAGWFGSYAVEEQPDEPCRAATPPWGSCRVLDLSMGGAGLELFGPEASVGDRVLMDVRLAEDEVAPVRLAGDVRHAASGEEGGMRIGVEFVALDDLERALLKRLLDRHKKVVRNA